MAQLFGGFWSNRFVLASWVMNTYCGLRLVLWGMREYLVELRGLVEGILRLYSLLCKVTELIFFHLCIFGGLQIRDLCQRIFLMVHECCQKYVLIDLHLLGFKGLFRYFTLAFATFFIFSSISAHITLLYARFLLSMKRSNLLAQISMFSIFSLESFRFQLFHCSYPWFWLLKVFNFITKSEVSPTQPICFFLCLFAAARTFVIKFSNGYLSELYLL